MHPFTLSSATSPDSAIVASIPHTGLYVPEDIKQLFISEKVSQLPMTDWFLHELYDFLPALGINVISANYSRYVIDLNRSPLPLELYPGRFETKLLADKDFQGEAIFSSYPGAEQIEFYTQMVHQPYHQALQDLLQKTIKQFGAAYLFDLHSIAKQATLVHAELEHDIYLGNRDDLSCSNAWMQSTVQQFSEQGFSIQKNNPYKGGFITHHYGLQDNIQALQIEMNQAAYLPTADVVMEDCAEFIQSEVFLSTKNKLKSIFQELVNSLK